jgi:uncharacterized protein (DUF2225 family)
MKTDSPLFYTTVSCPICGAQNKFENIRKGAYSISGTDTDFMPLGIKWKSEKMRNVNPLLFFIATCSKCYYSVELNESFKRWKDDTHFCNYKLKPLREVYQEHLKNENGLIKMLGHTLDPDNYPNETAICKLLLSIFQEKLNSHPSHLTLGRYYLRIGWIFRAMKLEEVGEESKHMHILLKLDDHFDMIENHFSQLDMSLKNLSVFFSHYMNKLRSGNRGLETDDRTDIYFKVLNDIIDSADSAKSKMDELKNMSKDIRNFDITDIENKNSDFKGYSGFKEFLLRIRNVMPEAPANEKEALTQAKEYYRLCLEAGRELKEGPQSFQAFYLIGELARRVGELDEAKRYLNTTINNGRKYTMDKNNPPSAISNVNSILQKAYTQIRLVINLTREKEAVAN